MDSGIKDQLHFVFVESKLKKWKQKGSTICGRNGKVKNLNQLDHPEGIIVDREGQIYIADCCSDRIMWWCEGDEEGEIIVDGNEPNQLSSPRDLSFDDEGNLYVVDCGNHRIQRFGSIVCEKHEVKTWCEENLREK